MTPSVHSGVRLVSGAELPVIGLVSGAPLRPGGAPGSRRGNGTARNWPPVSPTATRGAPSLAGGVAVCPWRAGHGAAWSPVQGGEALASCGGAGSRALGPHWVEGPVCGGGRCGGSHRLELWGPPLSGLHLGALQSRVVPVHALPRWGRVPPSRACSCVEGAGLQAGRSPFVCSGCVFPPLPREGAASHRSGSHRCVDHGPPGPRLLCALGAGGSPGRPLLQHCPPPRGASWASPTALYPDLFRARGRRGLQEAGGLGLCHPRPHPTERLRDEDPLKPRPAALHAGLVSHRGPRPPQPRSVASLSLPPHYAGPLLWTEGLGSMF